MSRRFVALFLAASIGLALLAAQPAAASNGMNMIGYGPYSISMGGADLATVGNPSAMNINPAGLARCMQPELDVGVSLVDPSLNHSDRFGNDRDDVLDRFPMPFLGYVRPVGDLTFGVGLFVQGGLGAEFRNLTTPFAARMGSLPGGAGPFVPATDTMRTNLGHARLTPAVAWQASSRLSLGASLNLSYAAIDMEFFPETSVRADLDRSGVAGDAPGELFAGMRVDDLSAVGYGLRLGFQYESGSLALGGTYSTKTELDFDGGTSTLNLSALGLGKVDYDAEMMDFAWPRQVGLGAAYRVNPRLLVAADVDWLEWSDAISSPSIKMTNPDRLPAPPSSEMPFRMDWRDQWVWAVGVELLPAESWAVRVGYNYGESPIPDDTLRPLFPAIADEHVTGGAGYTWGPWTLELGMEYALETAKTNNSLDPQLNLFGPGCTETLSQFMAHFTVRRALSKPARGAESR